MSSSGRSTPSLPLATSSPGAGDDGTSIGDSADSDHDSYYEETINVPPLPAPNRNGSMVGSNGATISSRSLAVVSQDLGRTKSVSSKISGVLFGKSGAAAAADKRGGRAMSSEGNIISTGNGNGDRVEETKEMQYDGFKLLEPDIFESGSTHIIFNEVAVRCFLRAAHKRNRSSKKGRGRESYAPGGAWYLPEGHSQLQLQLQQI